MQKRLDSLEEKVDKIMDNHLPHIQVSLEKVGTNQEWLMKFFWVVVPIILAGLFKIAFFP